MFHDLLRDIQAEPPLVWSDSEGCDLGRVTPLQMYRWPRYPGLVLSSPGVLLQLGKHLLPWSSTPIHHRISSPFTSLSIPISLHLLPSPPLHSRPAPRSTLGGPKRTSPVLTRQEPATSQPVILPSLSSTLPAAQVSVSHVDVVCLFAVRQGNCLVRFSPLENRSSGFLLNTYCIR